jgi:hypothetical protein
MSDFSAWDLGRLISGVADLGLPVDEEFRSWLMKAVYTHLRTIEEKGAVDFALAKLQQGDRSMHYDPRWVRRAGQGRPTRPRAPGGALPCPGAWPGRWWARAARSACRPPRQLVDRLPSTHCRPRAAAPRRWTHEELSWLPRRERDKRRILKDGWFRSKWGGWTGQGGGQ